MAEHMGGWWVKLIGDTVTLRVRLEGDRVTVTLDDGSRREWRDLIAIGVEDGKRKVVAVGETDDELRRGATDEQLWIRKHVRVTRALAPEGFDHEVARAYLAYVVSASRRASPWWKLLRKPRLELDLPGYSAVPEARRLAFEDDLRGWGHPTLMNGRPARAISPWTERASSAASLLTELGVGAAGMAWLAPEHRTGWLVRFVAALGLAASSLWWGERLKRSVLREARDGSRRP